MSSNFNQNHAFNLEFLNDQDYNQMNLEQNQNFNQANQINQTDQVNQIDNQINNQIVDQIDNQLNTNQPNFQDNYINEYDQNNSNYQNPFHEMQQMNTDQFPDIFFDNNFSSILDQSNSQANFKDDLDLS